jgi:hypothetical protein
MGVSPGRGRTCGTHHRPGVWRRSLYYALRMLTECVAWRPKTVPARPGTSLRSTVILIGHSHGVQPTTLQELHEQRGPLVRNTLDARFQSPAPSSTAVSDCSSSTSEPSRMAGYEWRLASCDCGTRMCPCGCSLVQASPGRNWCPVRWTRSGAL